MIFNCLDAVKLISRDLDNELGWLESLDLRIHRGICSYCRRYHGQLAAVNKAIRTILEESDPSQNLPEDGLARLNSRLQQEILSD